MDNAMLEPANKIVDYAILAILCPENEALPAVGGAHNCEEAETQIPLFKEFALNLKPDFAMVENPSDITGDDYTLLVVIVGLVMMIMIALMAISLESPPAPDRHICVNNAAF